MHSISKALHILSISLILSLIFKSCGTLSKEDTQIRSGYSKYFYYRFFENPTVVSKNDLREYLDRCGDYFAENSNSKLFLTMFVKKTQTQNQKEIAENLYNQIISYLVSRRLPRGQIYDRYGDITMQDAYFKYDDIIVEIVMR